MAKCSTDTCCLTLPLRLEKWQEDRLAKRFEIARQIYNTMVRAELKKLRAMEQSEPYKANQEKIQALDWKTQTDKQALKALYKERDKLLRDGGFSEYGFKSDIKNYYKHFNNNIGSNVAFHGIAPQVWAAFEKMLFKKEGKKVHFKKKGDIHSLRGYSAAGKSGGVEIIFRETYIEWKGLKLPLKLSPDNIYETQMLSYRVKYVRLLRKPGKRKDRWYAQLSLEGKPVIKYKKLVAYFSASGVTAKVAETLAEAIGADIFEIEPKVPYTEADLNWMDKKARSTIEMNDPASRPEIAVKRDNMKDYDTIFVGFPIWWYVAPTIINTFLESYDLTGKTIIPFATSGGSDIGKTNERLAPSCKGAKLMDGKVFKGSVGHQELAAWVEGLGL